MFFLFFAFFYLLGDILADAYTASRTALWILVGLALIELYTEVFTQ